MITFNVQRRYKKQMGQSSIQSRQALHRIQGHNIPPPKSRQQKMACTTACKTTIEKNYLLNRIQSTHALGLQKAHTNVCKMVFWQRGQHTTT